MKHPFHSIITDSEAKYLYGAFAERVQKFSIATGKLEAEYILPGSTGSAVTEAVDSPPRKKTKTDENGGVKEEKSSEGNKQEGPKAIRQILFSRDEKYIIATESKSVLILDALDLSLFSERTFPKRPSAVDTSVDDKDLLVGDKFGDVYSVPLLSKDALVLSSSEAARDAQSSSIEPILGHVSMLVDLTVAENDGKQYVITADRDEHIRVSNYPKSFVIERWLFGHTEFVSALCVLPWAKDTLISAGGDDFVAVWNWVTGELIQKFDIRSLIIDHLTEEFHTALRKGSDLEISVATIVPLAKFNQVAILCEATNAVIVLQIDEQTKTLTHLHTLEHPTSRIIDITASSDGSVLFASLDGAELVSGYTTTSSGQLEAIESPALTNISTHGSVAQNEGKGFQLYSIKHMRKRGEF